MAMQLVLGLTAFIMVLGTPCRGFLLPSFLEFGDCGTPAPKADFDPIKFSGRWYTVLWVPNEYIPLEACINANYTMHGDHMICQEKGLDYYGEKVSRQTILDFVEDPTSTFHALGEGLRPTAPMSVISTDYTTYACVYSCMKTFSMRAEFAWILSRHPRLDRKSVNLCKDALTEHSDFDMEKLEFVQQGEICPYWAHLPESWKNGIYSVSFNSINQLSAEVDESHKESDRKEMEETQVFQDLYYEPLRSSAPASPFVVTPSFFSLISLTIAVSSLT